MKYGFIGCGNMGGAIVRALRKSTGDIMISDRSGRAKALAEELGIRYGDIQTVAAECERVFLAVKPHMMAGVLARIAPVLADKKPLLITMAAGLSMERIREMAAFQAQIIRIMPNTPTAVGKGMILYCSADVPQAVMEDWLTDMQHCGRLDELEERLIDAGSALSGSGPAYAYIMLEALADGAVACGIPRAKAMEYAAATLAGSAEMYLDSHKHPGAMKDAVCSPGGSTIAGVRVLEQRGFRGALIDCVEAAYQKNKELGKA